MLICLLGAVFVGGSARVYACSCAAGQPAAQAGRADAVFTGTASIVVHHVENRIGDPNGPVLPAALPEPVQSFLRQGRPIYRTDNVEVSFTLDTSYKGDGTRETTVWANAGEAACGFDFQAGLRYTVFAERLNGRLTTGLCSGTLAGGITPLTYGLAPMPIHEGASQTDVDAPPVWAFAIALLAVLGIALGVGRRLLGLRRSARG